MIAECYQVVGAAGEIGYRVADIGRRRAQEGGSRHGVAGEEVLQGGGGTFSRVRSTGGVRRAGAGWDEVCTVEGFWFTPG